MQAPSWTDFLQCSVCTNRYNTTSLLPISLSCGHVICKKCLTEFMSRVCPYDKTAISPNAERLPPNSALLWLLGDGGGGEEGESCEPGDFSLLGLTPEDMELFKSSRNSIRKVAVYLQPLAEPGSSQVIHYLTRPMLKKLVTVVSCQFLEADGRARVLRATRSITDRTVTELLVMHQNQQQISTLLWSAIRSRGCQFLGPVMQEEALKLILKVLEGGAFLSRKNIVLYVVQQLQQQEFHQASKTSVGHVVQLLYRASCFNVEKRDEDSSRMQLKEEFRTYEALRREHDAQIIRVAMESGLRISPEQWSALLYGDQKHKSDMQSIIDKLLSQGIATSGLSELIVAIRRSQDQHNLLEKIVPHLEKLLHVDINIDKSSSEVEQWAFFSETMAALVAMLHEYSSFMRIQSGRYKTGLCPNLTKPGGCPKGEKCTYAHTEEERDKYRHLARGAKNKSRELGRPVSGPQSIPSRTGTGRWSGDVGTKLDSSPFSSLGPSYEGMGSGFSGVGGASQGYPTGGEAVGVPQGYSEYSTMPAAAVGGTTSIVLQQVMRQPPSLTSDPTTIISAQPQLVAYRSPHHSGPLTLSGEQLAAVYDSAIDPNYFRRSDSIPDDYSVVGVASDGRRYSRPALHPSYLATGPPAALESIKQAHADIKKNLQQPCYAPDDRTQHQYPSAAYLQTQAPVQYETYSSTGRRQVAAAIGTYVQEPHPAVEQRMHHHDNHTDHAPPDQQHVVVSSSVSGSSGVYVGESLSGEGVKGEGGEGGGAEAEGSGLAGQMSHLQLKDPTYYETTPYSSSAVGGTGSVSGYISSESYPQYSISQSTLLPHSSSSSQSRPLDPASLQTSTQYISGGGSEGVRASGGGEVRATGEELEMEAMKEKIRQLESQLAREKAKVSSQVAGAPPPLVPHSPAHSGLVYGTPTDTYPATQQFQHYATQVQQQVQMFPAGSAQQPAYYTPTAGTPTYQYTNWSGPQYSGDLGSGLQSGSYVIHQPAQAPPPQQTVRRHGVYVQQQQPLAQDLLHKDHMLAMYLQIQEQSKPYHQPHPVSALSSYAPSPAAAQQASAQMGYGGGASLGYAPTNHFLHSSGTQYVMKPF